MSIFIKDEAIGLLKECFRILVPAGIIRLGVPDAEIYLRAYVEDRSEFFKEIQHLGGAVVPLSNPMDVINQMFRMGGAHRFSWDFATLSSSLDTLEFAQIKRWNPGEASCSEICLDDSAHAFETMYVEALKPN